MRCPVHGPQDTTKPVCPVCMDFLVPDEPIAMAAAAGPGTCDLPGCGMPLADGGCPVHALDDAIASPATGGARATTRDRPTAEATAVLEFPWGTMDVCVGETWIGRSNDCGLIADRIDPYDNVSRRHAVVSWDGADLYVRDHESLNGTFVNDRGLPPRERRQLHDGDVVRFGADLRAVVRIPGARS